MTGKNLWLSSLVSLCLWSIAWSDDRPNVVLILADDHSYRDFGFMGNELVHTPHLDQLAEVSARYTHGYVPMSVCRPSLATFLTGLYPHQHGIHFNHPPPGLKAMRGMNAAEYHATRARADYLIRNVPTLPRILARNGYVCLQTGKHWEGDFRTAGFTQGMTLGLPTDHISSITGTRLQENGERVAHGNGDAGLLIGRETMQPIFDFVQQHAGRSPFFLWYAPFLPHAPFDAPERFRRLYASQAVPPELLPYYAEIARFDETVGVLLDYLQRKSLLENTLVVFASDNGFRPDARQVEQADQRSKLSQYEDGLRTPILIYWSGHTRVLEYDSLVHSIDIAPTILAAVGLSDEITNRMQGYNLMPSATGLQPPPERPVFGAIYPNDANALGQPSAHVRGRWVRAGNFKLTVPGEPGLVDVESLIPLSLFDLAQDPDEHHNLAGDPAYAGQVAKLEDLLNRWWTARDDDDVTRP